MALLDLYTFLFGGIRFVYMCGLVVDRLTLWFWMSVFAYAYLRSFNVFLQLVLFYVLYVFVVVVTPRLPMRTL